MWLIKFSKKIQNAKPDYLGRGNKKTVKVRGVVYILMPNGSSSTAQSKKMGLQTEGI
jgi:hypothetical protein